MTNNPDQIYVAIKFVTGDTCIGALIENKPLSVVIANPLTITIGLSEQDGEIVERLVMNKFCYLTNDELFTFNKKDILFCSSLKETLIEPYRKLCRTISKSDGHMQEGVDDDHSDLDDSLNEIPYIHPGSTTLN